MKQPPRDQAKRAGSRAEQASPSKGCPERHRLPRSAAPVDADAVEREALAQFSALAARIAPRGRRRITPAVAALNPAARRDAPSSLLVNRYTGRWRDAASGAVGLGAVDLVAYLADIPRDDAVRVVAFMLDEERAPT